MRLLIFVLFSCIKLLHFHKTRLEGAMPKVQLLPGAGLLPALLERDVTAQGHIPRWASTLVLSSSAHLLLSPSLPCCTAATSPRSWGAAHTHGSAAAPGAQSSRNMGYSLESQEMDAPWSQAKQCLQWSYFITPVLGMALCILHVIRIFCFYKLDFSCLETLKSE